MLTVSHKEDKIVITMTNTVDHGILAQVQETIDLDTAVAFAQEILDTCGHIDTDA